MYAVFCDEVTMSSLLLPSIVRSSTRAAPERSRPLRGHLADCMVSYSCETVGFVPYCCFKL